MKKYNEMTMKELQAIAKVQKIAGYSKMKKADLIAAIMTAVTTPNAGKTKAGIVKKVAKETATAAAHNAGDNYKDKDVNGVRHADMPHFAPLICKNGDVKFVNGGKAVYLVKEDFRKASEWKEYCEAVKDIHNDLYDGKECVSGIITLLEKHLGIAIDAKQANKIISKVVITQYRDNIVDASTVEGRAYLSAKKKAAAAREAADNTSNERRQKALKKKAAKFEAAMETLVSGGNVYLKKTVTNTQKIVFRHDFEDEVYSVLTGVNTHAQFEHKEKVKAENLKKDFDKYIKRAESLNAAGYAVEIPDEKHRTKGSFVKLRDAVKAAYAKKQADDAKEKKDSEKTA